MTSEFTRIPALSGRAVFAVADGAPSDVEIRFALIGTALRERKPPVFRGLFVGMNAARSTAIAFLLAAGKEARAREPLALA